MSTTATSEVPLLEGPYLQSFVGLIAIRPGCWEWQGTHTSLGYGRFTTPDRPRSFQAHRLAYRAFVGPIPDRLMVCHHCDNPRCVNPAHLFLGTAQDNMADASIKGRFNRRPDVEPLPRLPGKGPLSPERIARIRTLRADGYTQRQIGSIVGVDHSTVSRVLRERRYVEMQDDRSAVAL